jgi:phospholipid-binding lipoprotein MlaA
MNHTIRWIPGVRRALCVLAVASLTLAVSAASADESPSKVPNKDPFERFNRVTYRFNVTLDRHLLRPLAEQYQRHVPDEIRTGISNFVANIEYPTVIVNDALQGKLLSAGQDVARFVVNTIVGIGGLGDPASSLHIPVHNEDFGQTLGHWGVPAGPYIVLPVLGSSDLRDAPGWIADAHTSLEHYARESSLRWGIAGLSVFDLRVRGLAADEAIDNAFDPYALVRDAYLERRNYLVHDGNVPSDDSGYDVIDDQPTTEEPL